LALRPDVQAPDPLVLRLAAAAAVRGRVQGASGEPVPGVLARLQPAWDVIADRRGADLLHAVNAERAGGASALTGSDGAWEIPAVPAGVWRLTLERGGASRRATDGFTVAAQDVDLGVATFGGGLAVHGRVLTSDGRPVPEAVVRVQGDGAAGDGSQALGTVTTDVRGGYVATDLAAGRHLLEAQVASGARASANVDLKAPDTAVDLVLPAPAILILEVQHGSEPYRGLLQVRLRASSSSEGGTTVHQENVRVAAGRLELRGLPLGKWRLEVEAPGPLVQADRALPLIELSAGTTTTARASLGGVARLGGVLLDAAGAPVREGTVSTGTRQVRVDQRGRFALERLRPGSYALTAEGRGGAPVRKTVALVAGTSQDVELRLEPAGTLDVHVRDASGRPVPGALLAFGPTDRADRTFLRGEPRPLRTDPGGRARREDLPPIAITVRARTEAGQGTAQVTVRAGETTQVEVTLNAR
jgi:hypothetical protein